MAKDIAVWILAIGVAAELTASCAPSAGRSSAALGDPRTGARLVEREACGSCHRIPGKAGGIGVVGPPLRGIADRTLIAGFLPNTPAQMVRWLKSPQSILPLATMPDMGLTDHQARDIAAYLYTLR